MLKTKHKTVTFLAVVVVCLLALSCGGSFASKTGSPIQTKLGLSGRDFNFYDKSKFEVSIRSNWSDGGDRYLVDFTKYEIGSKREVGRFFAYSEDGAKTFGKTQEFSTVLSGIDVKASVIALFTGNGLAFATSYQDEVHFLFSSSGIDSFSVPAQVSDTPTSYISLSDMTSLNESHFCIVWTEKRDTKPRAYYSVSEDGGKTWTLSSQIDSGVSDGNQEQVKVSSGANGRLHAVWLDWSDKRTLADIRYTNSDDRGKKWSDSVKLNDDNLEVWQLDPNVLVRDEKVFVAFSDFREQGEFDDNDWNIYFASSDDNGMSWKPNRRLNSETFGMQGRPVCKYGINEAIYCVYLSMQETLMGRVMLSVSADSGETWTQEVPLTALDHSFPISNYSMAALSGGRIAVVEFFQRKGGALTRLSEVAPGFSDAGPIPKKDKIPVLKGRAEKVLFDERFSGKAAVLWEEGAGIWEIKDGVFAGVSDDQGNHKFSTPFFSFAKISPPESFVLSGKFKLDEVFHTTALIYLNVQDDRHIAITNQFRRGAWLGFDENPPASSKNVLNHQSWSQQMIAEKFYAFKKNKWYVFRIVVTPEQVDYYVDGDLFFSGRPEMRLAPGKIGFGGNGVSPAYFDDIVISELAQ